MRGRSRNRPQIQEYEWCGVEIYLPIAEMSMSPIPLLLLGAIVGLISGLFGVGGGFIMTPLLIFIGVPPAVAVGTQANQIVGVSVSGVSGYWRRREIDLRMAAVLLSGSLVGSILGVWIFSILRRMGQVDLVISILYVVVLGTIGLLMLIESLTVILKDRSGAAARKKNPPSQLDARDAGQDAVSALAALCLGAGSLDDWILGRVAGVDPGGWREFFYHSGDDLSRQNAAVGGAGNFAGERPHHHWGGDDHPFRDDPYGGYCPRGFFC